MCKRAAKDQASLWKSTGSPVHSFLDDAIRTSRASSYLKGSYDFYYNHSSYPILTSQHLFTIMKTRDPSCIKKENKSGGPTEIKWLKIIFKTTAL